MITFKLGGDGMSRDQSPVPLRHVVEALARCGIQLPKDVDEGSILRDIVVACNAVSAAQDDDGEPVTTAAAFMSAAHGDPLGKAITARFAADDRQRWLARLGEMINRGLPAADAAKLRREIAAARPAAGRHAVDHKLDLLDAVLPAYDPSAHAALFGTEAFAPDEATARKRAAWLGDQMARAAGLPMRKRK